MNNVTIIDLLRHGEVQGGACYRGSQDDALTETGWQQMQSACEGKLWDEIICSPLKRCADFARELSVRHHIVNDLKEIDFGDWEGKTADELFQQTPDHFTNFLHDPENHPPPNGENLSDFKNRISQQWQAIVQQHRFKHILLISHGGTMRSIISEIMKIPGSHFMRLEVPHASMSRIKIYHYGEEAFPTLVYHGKTF